jgi:hypothetical protein
LDAISRESPDNTNRYIKLSVDNQQNKTKVRVDAQLPGSHKDTANTTMAPELKYLTFKPKKDLESLVKCYWTLEVPFQAHTQKQLIIPDGCIEMIFILGDDVKRYTSGNRFILQPRNMVLGQITQPFYIQPTGFVNTFAVRFYPYGFANFVSMPFKNLANKETPLKQLFGEKASKELGQKIKQATSTNRRIQIVETFLLNKLKQKLTIDKIVKTTIDAMILTKGSVPITSILKEDLSKRRQIERKFIEKVGISPKKLGKVIRLQAALKMLLNRQSESLTRIAYDNDYYDQAHFTKDFKDFTGTTPKEFTQDTKMTLSSIIYKED